jgi:hypothetical protein
MRVPVLVVLSRHEPLVESALLYQQNREARLDVEEVLGIPGGVPGVQIDPRFPAVPIGRTGDPHSITAAVQDPANSDNFVIRGIVDTDPLGNVPTYSGSAQLFSDPTISPFAVAGGHAPVPTAVDVANKLKIGDLVRNNLDGDGVAVAVVDTGINIRALRDSLGKVPRFDVANSWSPPNTPAMPGQFDVNHGTMCAYDVLVAAPKATLLDFPALASPAPFSVTLSVAFMAFSQIIASWIVAPAAGGAGRYKALIISNSWGIYSQNWDYPAGHPGRYCDNPNHPFHALVSAVVRGGVDVVFAAGNCGREDPDDQCGGQVVGSIMGASAYPEVLTVAGCDANDRRMGYSSQGPSINGMHQEKPDLTAYTHFLGSEALGPGKLDTGTSAACPIAAGCIAALRTNTAVCSPRVLPPPALIAQLKATARQVGGGAGWTPDYGHGIIDPVQAAQTLGLPGV